jgi:hypothetical protein
MSVLIVGGAGEVGKYLIKDLGSAKRDGEAEEILEKGM